MADDEYKTKLRSLGFSVPRRREPRSTTDELGNTVTEHIDERVDVTVRPKIVRIASDRRNK